MGVAIAFGWRQGKGARMKIVKFAALVAVLGFGGCFTPEAAPQPVENVTVTLAQGRTLQNAVMTAATRRRWVPSAQGNVIRCTLSQREHLVVVDVVLTDAQTFSIRQVQSNIPVRKYDQWINNLSREIVYQASR